MNEYLYIILSFLISAAITAIAMPWLLGICYRRGIYDLPDKRKVHQSGVPRLGGVVFVPATMIGMFSVMSLMISHGANIPHTFQLSSTLIGSGVALLFFIGALDDLAECSANVKFIIQLCAAITFPICGLYINSLYGFLGINELPLWVAYTLTIFLTILIVNAINLIDGIDGLAACISIFALGVFGYKFAQFGLITFTLYTTALIGALVCFLLFNMWGSVQKHSKTFMGDSGSLLLGISLAYLTMKYAMQHSAVIPKHEDGLLTPIAAMFVPCMDLCRVALVRLSHHESIFKADKSHLHHKFMATGLSMRQTLCAIIALQIAIYYIDNLMLQMHLRLEYILAADVLAYSFICYKLPARLENASEVKETDEAKQQPPVEGRPFVSIVTSTYNSAATLRDTFNSILAQTFQDYEVIVVDGKSTDGTLDIIKEYSQKFNGRLKWKSGPDRGLYDAMNKGYKMARGTYVGLLNSDDFYSSADVLDTIHRELTTHDIDAVYADVRYVERDHLDNTIRYYSSRIFHPWMVRFGFMPAHPSFYCRRSLILQHGMFNIDYRVAADFDQMVRLLRLQHIRAHYIPQSIVDMREGGISNKDMLSRLTIMSEHKNILAAAAIYTNTVILSLRYIYKALEVFGGFLHTKHQLPPYIKP